MSKSGGHRAATLVILGGGIGLALWSGFPFRMGLTKSQARLSLPGDLLFPTAAQVGDRAQSFAASPAALWPGLLPLGSIYEEIWGCKLDVIYEEKNNLLVWQTANAPEGRGASLSVCLLPAPDHRTVVHLRERYESFAPHHLLATAAVVPGVWLRLRRSALTK